MPPVTAAGPGALGAGVHLHDVPATILWSLGVPRPASYGGRALTSILYALPVAA